MKKIILLMFLSLTTTIASAQYVAVKVNTLALTTATLNVGVDVAVGGKWSADGAVMWNPVLNNSAALTLGAKRWRFEPNVGWFWGVHSSAAKYNLNERKGYLAGVGSSLGYSWVLSKRWSFSLEGGIGVFYLYDKRLLPDIPATEDIIYRHHKQVVVAPSRFDVGFSYLF